MVLKSWQLYLFTIFFTAVTSAHDWDIAATTEGEIEFLHKNGTLIGVAYQRFNHLKAMAHNEINHEIIVADVRRDLDSIYSLDLSKISIPTPLVKSVSDDIKSVALDFVSQNLYWTDTLYKKILYLNLNDRKRNVLIEFKNEQPFGIVVDVCRRKLYWTNSNYHQPSIDSANLDGSDHQVIISKNLYQPTGLAIDQYNKRLYWGNIERNSRFSIQSSNLDGSDHKIVYAGSYKVPYGIAVNQDFIYWTDQSSDVLWSLPNDNSNVEPTKVRSFFKSPRGIILKNSYDWTRCTNGTFIFNNTKQSDKIESASDSIKCLNGGELTDHGCRCFLGFNGEHCEVDECYNYCNNGECSISSEGFPECKCPSAFSGSRCEIDLCAQCMNGATCTISSNISICDCAPGFFGSRCEETMSEKLCNLLCPDGAAYVSENGEPPKCRCNIENEVYAVIQNNETVPESSLQSLPLQFEEKLKDPLVLGLALMLIALLFIIAILSMTICRLKKRPRIKKRIIVNKNVTPLTCRPSQPTEQCEITIENCCNMNICETPCFEPPQCRGFQCSAKDEKKTLLTSMENGEDLY